MPEPQSRPHGSVEVGQSSAHWPLTQIHPTQLVLGEFGHVSQTADFVMQSVSILQACTSHTGWFN
jgi:hypothetical protein